MNPVMLVIPRFYLGSPIAMISVFCNMRGGWRMSKFSLIILSYSASLCSCLVCWYAEATQGQAYSLVIFRDLTRRRIPSSNHPT